MAEVESKYSCHICKIHGLIHSSWKDHQFDDDHVAKVKRIIKSQLYCEKCDSQFDNQYNFDRHCESEKHRGLKMTKDQLWCSKCNLQCQNKAKWEDHILTKKHLNTKKTKEELYCLKCNIQCHNNIQLENHLKCQKHINNTIINGTKIPRTVQQGVDQGSQTD